jgi:hypothetical protein
MRGRMRRRRRRRSRKKSRRRRNFPFLRTATILFTLR